MKQWTSVEQLQKEVSNQLQLIMWLVKEMGGTIEIPFAFNEENFEYNVEVKGNSFILSSRISNNV
jgi:hypothetical protein